MRTDQHHFDRVIGGPGRRVRVSCRPMGAMLRDLTDDDRVRWIQWFTAVPGVVSLVGFALHHTLFRRKWLVTVDPVDTPATRLQSEPLDKAVALALYPALVRWIEEGKAVSDFRFVPS